MRYLEVGCCVYSHFAQANAELFSSQGGEEFITVKNRLVMALYKYFNLLIEDIWFVYNSNLTKNRSKQE